MTPILRATRIGRVLIRYRLDALLDGTPAERWLRSRIQMFIGDPDSLSDA